MIDPTLTHAVEALVIYQAGINVPIDRSTAEAWIRIKRLWDARTQKYSEGTGR
jgi:hypothetical protein